MKWCTWTSSPKTSCSKDPLWRYLISGCVGVGGSEETLTWRKGMQGILLGKSWTTTKASTSPKLTSSALEWLYMKDLHSKSFPIMGHNGDLLETMDCNYSLKWSFKNTLTVSWGWLRAWLLPTGGSVRQHSNFWFVSISARRIIVPSIICWAGVRREATA